MALKPGDKANFQTLLKAAASGHLALMECKDAKTGEYRAVICAVSHDGGDYVFTPFGHLFVGDSPYDDYTPPEVEKVDSSIKRDIRNQNGME